jgi:putative chitinase
MWPNGNNSVPGLVEGIVAAVPSVLDKYGLNSELVIAHAMAQFSHESDAGHEMVENINYTASEADCFAILGSFAGDPDFHTKLIDSVYGRRNGNRPGTHDGSNYIGRGLSQVTGRGIMKHLARRSASIWSTNLISSTLPRVRSNAALWISSSAAACPSLRLTM